jgi:transcriptional regulator of acetoin/glycerol metabolism
MSHGKNMMLLTTYWGENKTFKLMPVNNDCPYMEVIYDTTTDMLVVITNNTKQNLQMVPKIDDDGNVIAAKKPKNNGKPFKEKQVLIEMPQEFYFIERAEQEEFIKQYAVNATKFDYAQFFTSLEEQLEKKVIAAPEAAPLVDANGKPIKAAKKKAQPAKDKPAPLIIEK